MGIVLLDVDEVEDDDAVGQPQGRLDGVGETLFGARLHDKPVDDDIDVVLFLLLELGRIRQRMDLAVDARTREALGLQFGEQIDELTLTGADDRGENLETGALVHRKHLIDDLLGCLLGYLGTTDRTVRDTRACVEQAQVVVDLGDRADRRARISVRRLLVDRHRGRETFDEVDVGLVHLAQELPRIRRQ